MPNKRSILSPLICMVIFVVLLSACASHSGASLQGTNWDLISVEPGNAAEPKIQPGKTTLFLEEGNKASGKAGCNSYGGTYEVKGDSIVFRDVASTLMACADEALMQQETAYLKALNSTGRFELRNNELTITYDEGRGKLIFKRSSNPPMSTP